MSDTLIKQTQIHKRRSYSQETSPEKTRSFEDRNDFYKSLVVQAHTTKKATKIQEKQAEKNLSAQKQLQEQPQQQEENTQNLESASKPSFDTFEHNMKTLFEKYENKMQEFQKIIQEQSQIIILQKDQVQTAK